MNDKLNLDLLQMGSLLEKVKTQIRILPLSSKKNLIKNITQPGIVLSDKILISMLLMKLIILSTFIWDRLQFSYSNLVDFIKFYCK